MPAMTSTERLFLQLERPGFPFDIAGLLMLEAAPEGPLPFEQVRALFNQRYHMAPLMTRVYAPAPLGVGQDRWAQAQAFDIDAHIHHALVPEPGDTDALLATMLKLSEKPLDRRLPLWDAWYLTGMADGTAALLMRMHHAAIDGMGIMQLLRTLHDTKPVPVDVNEEPVPHSRGHRPSVLRRTLYEIPDRVAIETAATTRLAKQAGSAVTDLARTTVRRAVGTVPKLGPLVSGNPPDDPAHLPELPGFVPSPISHPPLTLFNRHVYDSTKTMAVISLPLTEVERVRAGFPDVTVNDILLALVTGTLRSYLVAHDDLPEGPIRTTCPVNIRPSADKARLGNLFTTIWIDLPTHLSDPAQRLLAVHENAESAKRSLRQTQASWQVLSGVGDLMLPAVTAAGLSFVGRALDLLPPTQNLTVSTVLGSRKPIYLATRKITHQFARTIICPPITLFICSVTYNGFVDFSITSVAQLCPDPKTLTEGLQIELDGLLASAS